MSSTYSFRSRKKLSAAAIATVFLLSSPAFSASKVSPPPRVNAGKQIIRPGETPEQAKRNAAAHSNKLRNKVTIERALAASVDGAAPVTPLPASSVSLAKPAPFIDIVAAPAAQQAE